MTTVDEVYVPRHRLRFVTAASLFDGHDASINIIRRLLQARGVEVIHLGHNRSVSELVEAALQEDAQAIAVSSYQGGHCEYFRYLVDLLRERGAPHIRVFGGGGGVIVSREIRELESSGVTRIYSPEDGRKLGLAGIIDDMLRSSDAALTPVTANGDLSFLSTNSVNGLARLITQVETSGSITSELAEALSKASSGHPAPVIGITGTGGAGKSSVADELLRRLLRAGHELRVAVLSIDPTKRKTGGALLGDRIRMNSISAPHVYMRSLATRGSGTEVSTVTSEAVQILRASGFDVILVETSGIGQGSSAIADLADVSLYVMTPDYGATSQLEKIDMLDYAEVVVVNKFDRRGALDAIRDVRKQYRRNQAVAPAVPDEDLPIFGTVASQFGDGGVDEVYSCLLSRLRAEGFDRLPEPHPRGNEEPPSAPKKSPIPQNRVGYLGEITELLRSERDRLRNEVSLARRLYRLDGARGEVEDPEVGKALDERFSRLRAELSEESWRLVEEWPEVKRRYTEERVAFPVRDKTIEVEATTTTLSGTRISKVAVPRFEDWGEVLEFRSKEGLPGQYPFTAGVYPFKRGEESPRRQFAGEGGPRRTNERFHFLSRNDESKRLSTAFDSVTLYGEDPDERPDIFGKIGEGGVSIATLDDMKLLYLGFDLADPKTSVSMTINGPASTILAMFFNTAIDQAVRRFEAERETSPDPEELENIRSATLSAVRGTVQADILKEDQAQNTCIFSTEFALRLMGDVQQYFIDHHIRNFYSVSISGYHIAEAGANPITQLAFTLANGFTYVEYYLARGMCIDDFAPNLSFFFSNGLDPEYAVMGRVARRIWARGMRERYGANERSQKFKYHIQTSGRSLHAREIQFNDIRTTIQALSAIYDHCNSLHTNAYDEAITTPTEESVRRAMAIQQIIGREFGMTKNENPLQGSFIVEELTDLVEEAVLAEFDRLNARGGVLGAMELQYQRGRIQEESLHYELKKDSGELPIVGVNCFLGPDGDDESIEGENLALARASAEEKSFQLTRLRAFHDEHAADVESALSRLRRVAASGQGNVFAELMHTVRVASLGQITHALYEVGGQYRRAM
jgi:methylmalonyl-CoA mutase